MKGTFPRRYKFTQVIYGSEKLAGPLLSAPYSSMCYMAADQKCQGPLGGSKGQHDGKLKMLFAHLIN